MRTYVRGFVIREESSTGAADAPLRVVATTEGRKADGIDLRMSNADLARYEANPVLMYGHDYWGREALPIGHAEDIEIDGARLLESLAFDQEDAFAATVERKMRNRHMNAVSIGFDAHDIGTDGVPARWELFETSVVPLPMDPDALVESGRDIRDARTLARFLDAARAGKVLSSKNQTLVQDAIAALTALLESASKDDGEDDEGRAVGTPRLGRAAARLAGIRH